MDHFGFHRVNYPDNEPASSGLPVPRIAVRDRLAFLTRAKAHLPTVSLAQYPVQRRSIVAWVCGKRPGDGNFIKILPCIPGLL
jgi:hypothetical protein